MPDTSHSPALSDAELRETLDLLATILASVSDRTDSQSEALDRLAKVSAETRQAAFAARTQSDPEPIVRTLGEYTATALRPIQQHLQSLAKAAQHDRAAIKQELEELRNLRADLHRRRARATRVRTALPWLGLGALVLILALSVGLPRVLSDTPWSCAAIGGTWGETSPTEPYCVFFPE